MLKTNLQKNLMMTDLIWTVSSLVKKAAQEIDLSITPDDLSIVLKENYVLLSFPKIGKDLTTEFSKSNNSYLVTLYISGGKEHHSFDSEETLYLFLKNTILFQLITFLTLSEDQILIPTYHFSRESLHTVQMVIEEPQETTKFVFNSSRTSEEICLSVFINEQLHTTHHFKHAGEVCTFSRLVLSEVAEEFSC